MKRFFLCINLVFFGMSLRTGEAFMLGSLMGGGDKPDFIPAKANFTNNEKTIRTESTLRLDADEFLDFQKERISASGFYQELMEKKSNFFTDLYEERNIAGRKVGFVRDSLNGSDVGTGALGLALFSLTSGIQAGYLRADEWKEKVYRILLGLYSIQEQQPKGEWLNVFKSAPLPLVRGIVNEFASLSSVSNDSEKLKAEFSAIIDKVAQEEGWEPTTIKGFKDYFVNPDNLDKIDTVMKLLPGVTVDMVNKVADYGMDGGIYHFINLLGKRSGDYTEVSSIDSVMPLQGARYAAAAYPDYKPAGEQFSMQELADMMFRNFNFNSWIFFDVNKQDKYLHGWRPKLAGDTEPTGRINPGNSYFGDERLILELFRTAWLLDRKEPVYFDNLEYLKAYRRPVLPGLDHYASYQGAAWTYQYAHLFYRFFKDDEVRDSGKKVKINWYENTVHALLGNIDYSMHDADLKRGNYFFGKDVMYKGYYPYDALVTTTTVPNDPQAHPQSGGFQMDHGTPLGWDYRQGKKPINDGTFTPSGFAASSPFIPFRSFQTLKYQYMTSLPLTRVAGHLHQYFFSESINRRMNWFSTNNITLNESIFYMGLINALHNGLIWETMERDPLISKALDFFGIKGDVNLAIPELNAGVLENATVALEKNRDYASSEIAVKELYKIADTMNQYNDRRALTLFGQFLSYSDRISESAYNALGDVARQTQDPLSKAKALALQFVVAKNNIWIADQVRIFRDELIPLIKGDNRLVAAAREIIYNYDYEFKLIAGKYKVQDGRVIPEYGLFGPMDMANKTIEQALRGELVGARVYYPDIFKAR